MQRSSEHALVLSDVNFTKGRVALVSCDERAKELYKKAIDKVREL